MEFNNFNLKIHNSSIVNIIDFYFYFTFYLYFSSNNLLPL